mmetsp:Transcript_13074/g.38983  ORF Transcript_13074/g.38983 Transcript_13074/m.38983 type:complete len:96 (+) Transcript_13074:72-359(+)
MFRMRWKSQKRSRTSCSTATGRAFAGAFLADITCDRQGHDERIAELFVRSERGDQQAMAMLVFDSSVPIAGMRPGEEGSEEDESEGIGSESGGEI